MKWFKHDADASNDAKLKKLRLKYGAQGYGIYWYCLELIARNVEKHNLTFELEHDAELIADDFKLSSDLVQHIMTYMVELELFENINGVVSCLKMANRTDEYTQKLLQSIKKVPDSVGIVSGQTPTKSVLIEEKRTEENRTEQKLKYLPPIPSELLSEWLNVRKKKRSGPVTELVWKSLVREANKLGWTPEKAVTYCCEKSWTNLEAEWVNKGQSKSKTYQEERLSVSNAAFGNLLNKYAIEERDITND